MVPKELLKKFLINLTHSVKPNKPHLFGKTEQIDLKTMKFFGRYTWLPNDFNGLKVGNPAHFL